MGVSDPGIRQALPPWKLLLGGDSDFQPDCATETAVL